MVATLPDLVADAEQNGNETEAGTSSGQRQTKQARQKELLASAVEHCAATTDTVRTNAAGWGLCEETPLFHQVFLVQYAGYYLVF